MKKKNNGGGFFALLIFGTIVYFCVIKPLRKPPIDIEGIRKDGARITEQLRQQQSSDSEAVPVAKVYMDANGHIYTLPVSH